MVEVGLLEGVPFGRVLFREGLPRCMCSEQTNPGGASAATYGARWLTVFSYLDLFLLGTCATSGNHFRRWVRFRFVFRIGSG